MSTTSIGINKWAAGMEITEICRSGAGDNRVIAWRRSDGVVALETNGDPAFGDDAEKWIAEYSVREASPSFRFANDAATGVVPASSLESAYAQLRSTISPEMIADGATLWVEDDAGRRITMGVDRD